MRPLSVSRLMVLMFILATSLLALDRIPPAYQKGTITTSNDNSKSYDLKGSGEEYQINHCGDFQSGQQVDYRVQQDKVYISRDGGKEYKCSIQATEGPRTDAPPQPITYLKGTILGYEAVYRISKGSTAAVRRANVYSLRGPDLIYQFDFCGAFQAGQFTAGQVVEFRVDGDRLYILRDTKKEYSCQIEGRQKVDSADAAADATQPDNSSSAPPSPAADVSTVKLTVTSVPDGADIEVDGNFSGNTPSDIQIPEGEHAITVKKTGYKDWERKMKLLAGSNIHLNAEMEKTTTP
jgi:PEGA domain